MVPRQQTKIVSNLQVARLILFSLILLANSIVHAGALFAPLSLDSTSTLPSGVRNLRVGGFSTEVSERFDPSGASVPLASDFNKPVTWGNLTDAQTPGFERAQFKGGLQALGIKMSDVVGESRGIVNSRITTTLPIMAYGVRDDLTVGLAVPIVYSNVNVSTGWAANSEFQGSLDRLSTKGFYNKVLANENKLQNVVSTKIEAYGYKPLVGETHNEVGDVTVAAKYRVHKSESLAVVVAPRLVLPTGRVADVDKVVDVAPGDGQWDVGATLIGDYSPIGPVTITVSGGYLAQLPNLKSKRIPLTLEESISGDVDSSTHENLGDILSASFGGRYTIQDLWVVGAGYSLQHKGRDTYSGSKFSQERYNYLSDRTEQYMNTAQAGLTFSTIPLYRTKQFSVPLEASLNYSLVFAGRNVNRADLAFVDVAMYF
jgi:hypothetical protein